MAAHSFKDERVLLRQRQAKEELLREREPTKGGTGPDPSTFGKREKISPMVGFGNLILKSLPVLFGMAVLLALFIGYRLREYDYYTAEEGIGYTLGIVGAGMMLALLLYPLRKRFRILKIMGDVRAWFGLHMVLGVLGPLLILFHSNFSLGSTNSNVALFSMLIVSASGVAGRYIYTKIHNGLYGQKIELAQLKKSIHQNQEEMTALLLLNPETRDELFDFVDHVLTPPTGFLHSLKRILTVSVRSRLLLRKTNSTAWQELNLNPEYAGQRKKELKAKVRLISRESNHLLQQARKVVEFYFYERMFALWHVLHLPLFFMLVIAAIVHVVAVHWY